MKKIAFTKMHALGNDFIVIDGVNQKIKLTPPLILELSDRHRGVGFDQCLLIESTTKKGVDFSYTIFNADGSEVGQCGNGARCVARFIHENQLIDKKIFTLATRTTNIRVEIHDEEYEAITASLSVPNFGTHAEQFIENIGFHELDVGNPHAVIWVKDVAAAAVDKIGQLFNAHSFFPGGVNVGFMQIESPQKLKLRVFERGVGETQACGSGACAAMVCAKEFYKADSHMEVELPGGRLNIDWEGEGHPVSLTGNAVRVFDGFLHLP